MRASGMQRQRCPPVSRGRGTVCAHTGSRMRAAVAEGAAGEVADQRRHHARDGAEPPARGGASGHRECSPMQPAGVGMARVGEHVCRRAILDDLAGIHDGHPVGDARDHAEVVRDQHHRDAELALQICQQPQDLRLDGDVERGGRLVGDQQLRARTSAPWRSSRAGAGRRRAGADTVPGARRPRRCRPSPAGRRRASRASRRAAVAMMEVAPPSADCRWCRPD